MMEIPKELNLFDQPQLTAPYQKVQYVEYRPSSALNDGGPLQFTIPPSANQFIDLRRSRIHVKCCIERVDKAVMTALADKVTPINLVLHSLFSQVDVQLQQQLVSSNQLYPYKAYVETLLHYDEGAKKTFLQSQGYAKDRSEKIDVLEPGGGNPGLNDRFGWFATGKVIDFEGLPMADICQQERMVLNGVEINMRLWRTPDAFLLLAAREDAAKYTLVLKEVYLRVCKVIPAPPITLALSAGLKEKPAVYPYTRTEMRAFNLQRGAFQFHLEDVYQQSVPSEIIIGMVKSKAFNGAVEENPFNFQDFNISSVGVNIDDESVPARAMSLDFTKGKGNYMAGYQSLFGETPTESNYITRFDYSTGYTLFRFRLTPEQADATPSSRGNVKVMGTFAVQLPEDVTLLIMGKFLNMLTIDETRSITI
jgi:hypothetical protein